MQGKGEIPEHLHGGTCQLVRRFDASKTHTTFFFWPRLFTAFAADVTLEMEGI